MFSAHDDPDPAIRQLNRRIILAIVRDSIVQEREREREVFDMWWWSEELCSTLIHGGHATSRGARI
jgi:hypothetical protein